MHFKLVLLILTIIINIQSCLTNEKRISCNYQKIQLDISLLSYQCQLTIKNPNGSDDFQDISGTHWEGYSDEDVLAVYANDVESENIPKKVCEKFKNIQKIEFINRNTFQSGSETLKNCKNLSSMSISLNYMNKINENVFSGVENLKVLKIKNQMNLPKITSVFNKKLVDLSLNENVIFNLPEKLFSALRNLKVLSLNENDIFDLPENIFQSQENLEELLLSKNKINNLRHKWFTNMKKLKKLNFNNNRIYELPKDIFTPLMSLETIELSNNKIKVISSNSFGILPKLTAINLYLNKINAIDEQFIDNTGVVDINLYGSKCYNTDFFDNSTTRDALFLELQNCFKNYEIIKTSE